MEKRAVTELSGARAGRELGLGLVLGALLFSLTIGFLAAIGRAEQRPSAVENDRAGLVNRRSIRRGSIGSRVGGLPRRRNCFGRFGDQEGQRSRAVLG